MGLMLLAGLLPAQQWERLPLNVGYLDKLVQNPYNPMEIVGYLQSGDFYRSTDGGSNWLKIEQVDAPFQRNYYSDLSFDSQNRMYLIALGDGLYRSTDGGLTWDSLLVRGRGYFGSFSRVRFSNDASIFVWESGIPALFRSTDDGETWEEIGPKDVKVDIDLYVDDENSDILAVFSRREIVVTTDGGSNWIPYPLPEKAESPLFSHKVSGQLHLLYTAGGVTCDLYESLDTGKTWLPYTPNNIDSFEGDCSDVLKGAKYIFVDDSTIIYHLCCTLQLSTDTGKSFRQITNFRVMDAVLAGTDIIASVPLHGLLRSTDFGDSWSPVPSPPEVYRVDNQGFAHAHNDTLFVWLSDWNTNSRYTTLLLESNDGGFVWDTLFSANTYIREFFVDAGRPSRYYLYQGVADDRYGDRENRYMLLSGVAGQGAPDTILVTTSIHCIRSERFPGWIYASRNTNSIGWSSDRGENWEWLTLPISCSSVSPCPTQRDPLRIIVTASERNPIPLFDYSGLYLIENGGNSVECVNRSDELGGPKFTTSTDRIFRHWPEDMSSTDYGRTWESMRVGLDTNTTTMENYQSHGWTLTATNTGIYLFDDERWNLLRDRDGNSIWNNQIQAKLDGGIGDLEYTGDYVYAKLNNRGLYRIATQPVTGIRSLNPANPSSMQLEVSPNPLPPGRRQLRVTARGLQPGPALLMVTDLLGRSHVHRAFEVTGNRCEQPLDLAGLNAGVYLLTLRQDNLLAQQKLLLF